MDPRQGHFLRETAAARAPHHPRAPPPLARTPQCTPFLVRPPHFFSGGLAIGHHWPDTSRLSWSGCHARSEARLDRSLAMFRDLADVRSNSRRVFALGFEPESSKACSARSLCCWPAPECRACQKVPTDRRTTIFSGSRLDSRGRLVGVFVAPPNNTGRASAIRLLSMLVAQRDRLQL
jgi:hypothetical protein